MERIAVKTFTPIDVYQRTSFKKDILFFDKIYMHPSAAEFVLKQFEKNGASSDDINGIKLYCSEIDFLLKKGLLKEYKLEYDDFTSESQEEKNIVEAYSKILKGIFVEDRFKIQEGNKIDAKGAFIIQAGFDYRTRLGAIALRKQGLRNVIPLLATKVSLIKGEPNQNVLSIVLSKLPIPDENTSWEQIIDFRNDEDSQLKYLALVNWINSVASSNRPLHEVEDEFEYLYHQYQRAFKLHKMKANLTTLELIVSGGLEVLTAIQGVPIFFKNLLSISKTRIEMMEVEIKLPGQEIAYIHKANETFNI